MYKCLNYSWSWRKEIMLCERALVLVNIDVGDKSSLWNRKHDVLDGKREKSFVSIYMNDDCFSNNVNRSSRLLATIYRQIE